MHVGVKYANILHNLPHLRQILGEVVRKGFHIMVIICKKSCKNSEAFSLSNFKEMEWTAAKFQQLFDRYIQARQVGDRHEMDRACVPIDIFFGGPKSKWLDDPKQSAIEIRLIRQAIKRENVFGALDPNIQRWHEMAEVRKWEIGEQLERIEKRFEEIRQTNYGPPVNSNHSPMRYTELENAIEAIPAFLRPLKFQVRMKNFHTADQVNSYLDGMDWARAEPFVEKMLGRAFDAEKYRACYQSGLTWSTGMKKLLIDLTSQPPPPPTKTCIPIL
jgi:hypothetical protein